MVSEQHAINLETVEDLKRIYVQQFRRFMDAHKAQDGPTAGKVMVEIIDSHRDGCAVMLDTMAYLIGANEQQASALAAAQAENAALRATQAPMFYDLLYAMTDWLENAYTSDICDAGNWDGGSSKTCEHCIVSGMVKQARAILAGDRDAASAGEGT